MLYADYVGNEFSKSQNSTSLSFIVAIPVNNECERIITCLNALKAQSDIPPCSFGILLFLNNCTDGTRNLVEKWRSFSSIPVRLVEEDSMSASAGWARRKAMDAAVAWFAELNVRNGVLLTTDADSRVSTDWVARNCAAIAAGADAIAGRIVFDPAEVSTLSPGTLQRLKLESQYEALLAEIEARLAPQHGNPWPCHWMKSGASIAVSLDAYRAVGGMPLLRSGEDRAFIDLLRTRGFIVRHADDVVVTTSSRLEGRACGGTADTLRGWDCGMQQLCDNRLQRLGVFVFGVLIGRRGRSGALLASELPRQIARAQLLLRCLRWRAGDRADRPRVAAPTTDAPTPMSMP